MAHKNSIVNTFCIMYEAFDTIMIKMTYGYYNDQSFFNKIIR